MRQRPGEGFEDYIKTLNMLTLQIFPAPSRTGLEASLTLDSLNCRWYFGLKSGRRTEHGTTEPSARSDLKGREVGTSSAEPRDILSPRLRGHA